MQQDGVKSNPSERMLLWVLLIVYIFNFIDRQIVNILAEPIRKDLNLTDTQIGLMTGLAFALFYTFLGLPIARYADRPSTDRTRLIAVALAIWSAMTALCGLAQNFWQLLLARIGVGVGEAGCTPAAHSLIADRVPKERRASALAFYALGIPIGSLLGAVIGGQLADYVGWRHAFLYVGFPGVLLAMVVVVVLRDHGRALHDQPVKQATAEMDHPSAIPDDGMGPLRLIAAPFRWTYAAILGPAMPLLKQRTFVLLLIAASASAFLSYGKGTWVAIFLQRDYGLTPGQVGLWFGVLSGIAAVAGTWLGGWFADRWGRTNRRHVLTAPAIGMVVAAPLAYWAYQATDWRYCLAMLLLPTLLNSLYYGPLYSCTQGLVPLRSRASASALLLFCQNLIGLGLGPLFFGMLSDWLKPQLGADSVRYVLYGAAWLGLIPALFYWRTSLRLNDELDQYE